MEVCNKYFMVWNFRYYLQITVCSRPTSSNFYLGNEFANWTMCITTIRLHLKLGTDRFIVLPSVVCLLQLIREKSYRHLCIHFTWLWLSCHLAFNVQTHYNVENTQWLILSEFSNACIIETDLVFVVYSYCRTRL